jgi:hypothetical protein
LAEREPFLPPAATLPQPPLPPLPPFAPAAALLDILIDCIIQELLWYSHFQRKEEIEILFSKKDATFSFFELRDALFGVSN